MTGILMGDTIYAHLTMQDAIYLDHRHVCHYTCSLRFIPPRLPRAWNPSKPYMENNLTLPLSKTGEGVRR